MAKFTLTNASCLLGRFWIPGIDMSISVVPRLWRCLASRGNFIYVREEANVHRHVTSMPVLIRSTNNFLDQFIGGASEGKYNTVNKTTSGGVTFQKCLNSGLPITTSKNNN